MSTRPRRRLPEIAGHTAVAMVLVAADAAISLVGALIAEPLCFDPAGTACGDGEDYGWAIVAVSALSATLAIAGAATGRTRLIAAAAAWPALCALLVVAGSLADSL